MTSTERIFLDLLCGIGTLLLVVAIVSVTIGLSLRIEVKKYTKLVPYMEFCAPGSNALCTTYWLEPVTTWAECERALTTHSFVNAATAKFSRPGSWKSMQGCQWQ